MGYSARRGFTNGSMKMTGAQRQAEMQARIQQMQEQVNAAQEAVEAQEFTASVGGGVVEAKVNGKKEVLAVTIKPEAVDPEDVKMQQDMMRMQQELQEKEYSAAAGGGVVSATVNGKHELRSLTIDPEAVDPEDVEMLQDLVVSAVNEALRQAGEAMDKSIEQATGGLDLGAFGL